MLTGQCGIALSAWANTALLKHVCSEYLATLQPSPATVNATAASGMHKTRTGCRTWHWMPHKRCSYNTTQAARRFGNLHAHYSPSWLQRRLCFQQQKHTVAGFGLELGKLKANIYLLKHTEVDCN
jgi:hypothetical protein